MVKTLIKIVIALLVVHGAFRVGNAYWNFYRFEDALQQLAQFGERRTDRQLCDEAMNTAGTYGVPIAATGLTILRGNNPPFNCEDGAGALQPGAAITQASAQMTIEGSYMERLQVLPGYFYPWEFRPSVRAWLRP
jgi:hypothetical protein